MNRMFGSLAVVALLPLAAAGQEVAPWANKFFTKETPPPAVIVHDFGTVPQGTLLSHKFPITNIYAVPMQITEIRKSCGCVNAVASTQVLQARETATIDVTMDARKFSGPRTVTIYVTVGPQFISTALLQVRAISRADIMLNPGSVNFGVVPQGQKMTQAVDVVYTGQTRNWQLTGVVGNNLPYDVQLQPVAVAQGRAFRVFVTLKANASPGALDDEIVLQTNDPTNPTVNVQVAGVIQAPLSVAGGESVKLKPTAVGGVSEERKLIRGPKAFKILRVEGEGDGLTVELPPVARELQIVNIRYQPTQAGAVRRQLLFHTDLGRDPVVITVEGSAQ